MPVPTVVLAGLLHLLIHGCPFPKSIVLGPGSQSLTDGLGPCPPAAEGPRATRHHPCPGEAHCLLEEMMGLVLRGKDRVTWIPGRATIPAPPRW